MPLSVQETADRLEWFRHYTQLNQKQFARSIGVLPSTYNNWLHGKHGLTRDGAVRIYEIYSVTPDFFFLGETGNLPDRIRDAWGLRI